MPEDWAEPPCGGSPILYWRSRDRCVSFIVMVKKKKSVRGKKTKTRAAKASPRKKPPSRTQTPTENPAWVSAEPTGTAPAPPVVPRAATLPFLQLSWENFERLCYRLAQKAGQVEKVWAYGTQGHEQLGIDVLVRMSDGSFETWQSKRHQTFGPAQLTAAVNHFLKGKWANEAKKFVLAVACDGTAPNFIDAIEKARDKLAERGIAFEPLFERELSEKLKTEAEIVDDLFGRPWLERFCATELIAALADRISRIDINSLRMRLRSLYTAWIGVVDPGLPLVGQIGAETPSPELSNRYVVPEVILPLGLAADERIVSEAPQSTPGTRGARNLPVRMISRSQQGLRLSGQ